MSNTPTGIEHQLSHGLGGRASGSQYDLGGPSSGGFSLLTEKPVSPKRCDSSWRGSEKGFGSWVSGTLDRPSMPMLAGMSFLCRSGGLGKFFFCIFYILTRPFSSCSCGGLGRRLNTKPCSALCRSHGPGMPISRPCIPTKDDVSQDPKPKLFKYISLSEEVAVLKGQC